MSEIKPVYQVMIDDQWTDCTKSELQSYGQLRYSNRALYPAAAYEALQKENEKAITELTRLVSLNDKFRENENRLTSDGKIQLSNDNWRTMQHTIKRLKNELNNDKSKLHL